MNIGTCAELLQWAHERRASAVVFCVYCADLALGVLDAAKQLGSPVILGVD